jgi:hypothetical protein
MSHFTHFNLSTSAKLTLIAALLTTSACAARPAAPAAAAPTAAAPAETGSGVAEQQPPPNGEDFVFVTKDHKDPTTHDDAAPATSLHADQSARKQRVAH